MCILFDVWSPNPVGSQTSINYHINLFSNWIKLLSTQNLSNVNWSAMKLKAFLLSLQDFEFLNLSEVGANDSEYLKSLFALPRNSAVSLPIQITHNAPRQLQREDVTTPPTVQLSPTYGFELSPTASDVVQVSPSTELSQASYHVASPEQTLNLGETTSPEPTYNQQYALETAVVTTSLA